VISLVKAVTSFLIETIFPHFCIGCNKYKVIFCSNCYEQIEFLGFEVADPNTLVACKYSGIVENMVHEYKYKGVKDLGKIIARIMFYSLDLPKVDLLVPVPLDNKKRRLRGFSQTEEIAKELSILTQTPHKNLLMKTKSTVSQMSLDSKEDRERNLEGAFVINEVEIDLLDGPDLTKNNTDKKILLIDDIFTTGSTVNECSKVLNQAGFKNIFVATFASGS
jgi:competence protein ComFC